jgi:hypothetical protein
MEKLGFVLVEGLETADMLRLKAQSGEDVSKSYRRLFCECLCQNSNDEVVVDNRFAKTWGSSLTKGGVN